MHFGALGIGVVGKGFAGEEWRVCGGGEDPVEPCLLVFMAGGSEGCTGQLFSV
jgi:hypothetical protein